MYRAVVVVHMIHVVRSAVLADEIVAVAGSVLAYDAAMDDRVALDRKSVV